MQNSTQRDVADESEFFKAFFANPSSEDAEWMIDNASPEWFTRYHEPLWCAVLTASHKANGLISRESVRFAGGFTEPQWLTYKEYFSSSSNKDISPWINELQTRYTRRVASKASSEILESVDNMESLDELLEKVRNASETIISAGSKGGSTPTGIEDSAACLSQGIPLLSADKSKRLVWFGLPLLDTHVMALPGSVGIVAAKASGGKSSIVKQCVVECAKHSITSLLITLEESREEADARILSNMTGVDSNSILFGGSNHQLTPEQWSMLSHIKVCQVHSGERWSSIERSIRDQVKRNGCRVVIIDYFTLLQPPDLKGKASANMSFIFGELSKAIKRIASQLQIAIVIVSQLNRTVEDGAEPSMYALRETGQLEQDAHWVITAWTEKKEYEPGEDRTVFMKLQKNRGGQRWVQQVSTFTPATCRFSNLERTTSGWS